jgi:hypothetical protein
MMVVGALMLKGRSGVGEPSVRLNRENLPKLLASGLVTGALSGFFGIGGGFLIVPALIVATGMPILYAVGSSLVKVTAFGLTTAANYALSGIVDWSLAALFISGGVLVLASQSHCSERGDIGFVPPAGGFHTSAGFSMGGALSRASPRVDALDVDAAVLHRFDAGAISTSLRAAASGSAKGRGSTNFMRLLAPPYAPCRRVARSQQYRSPRRRSSANARLASVSAACSLLPASRASTPRAHGVAGAQRSRLA